MFTRSRSLSGTLALLAWMMWAGSSVIARASPIRYTFTGTANASNEGITAAFQYTAPDFITADSPGVIVSRGGTFPLLPLLLSELDSCTNCSPGAVFFTPEFQQIQLNAVNNAAYVFLFPAGTFTTVGTHISLFPPGPGTNSATLTVTDVPEPSTFVLVGFSVAAAVLVRPRRMFRRPTP